VASNYYAQVNAELCQGCETCVGRCPMEATRMDDGVSSVDLARCIGCGLCIPTCPENALSLAKKEQQFVPPQTEEDLLDLILAGKQSQAQAL
jgi:Fe-S-cluster-containing hydrogenase component 2